ncbi:MAG: Ig-like domain-containing protein, partial [Leptospiraceae bacterium]|nr:Ig-like domain-containing protein [Leptospiraceae bacterium]
MRFKKSIFVVSIKYLCPALFLFTSPFCKNELQKLNEDVESATFTALPRDNATLQDLTQIEISFSDLMRGMTVLSNYKISGTGAASLQPSNITDLGGNRVRLTLSGFPKTGSFFLTLSNITDSKNRPLAQSVLSYNLVIPGPTISTSPTENSVLSSLTQLDVTFSLPVNAAATQTSSYSITNASGGSLVVDSVSQLTTTSYRLVISGNLGNGTFTLHTTGIESLAGNVPQNPNLSFVADTTAPSVVSSTPTGGTTLANLDNITIQFSERVENAAISSSYTLSGTGKGSLSISSIASLGSNNFQLNFSGSPTNGVIEITLSGIRDLAGNLLGSTALNFTGDTVNPTITSSSTASGSTINALTSLDITYSRAVNGGANLGNYSLSGTGVGSLAITSVTNISGNVYRLVFSGSPVNGSIQISISGISAAANLLPLVSGSLTYNVDLGLPTIISSTPTAGTLLNSLTQLDIVYSEVMANAGNSGSYSISNNGTGSLNVVSAANISGNQYRLTLSGTVGNGSFSVTSNATDLAGNSNAANVLNFNADNVTPTIVSSTPANSSSLNALTTIEFTFSEAVSGALNSGNYSLTGAGAVTLSISGVSSLGGNSYRINIAGTPQNGTINLAMANISDTAGNTISGTVLTYTGDFSGPTATTNPANSGFISSLTTLDITYSEPVVNAATLTNYSISGSGQGSLTLQSVNPQGGNVYRLIFTGTPVNGTLSLNITNILDSFGNALTTTAFSYT